MAVDLKINLPIQSTPSCNPSSTAPQITMSCRLNRKIIVADSIAGEATIYCENKHVGAIVNTAVIYSLKYPIMTPPYSRSPAMPSATMILPMNHATKIELGFQDGVEFLVH